MDLDAPHGSVLGHHLGLPGAPQQGHPRAFRGADQGGHQPLAVDPPAAFDPVSPPLHWESPLCLPKVSHQRTDGGGVGALGEAAVFDNRL